MWLLKWKFDLDGVAPLTADRPHPNSTTRTDSLPLLKGILHKKLDGVGPVDNRPSTD